MVMEDKIVKINAIIDLLAVNAPSRLALLWERFPEHSDLLKSGLQLGSKKVDRRSRVMQELVQEGLGTAEQQIARLLAILPNRLARAKRLKLLAALISSISSVGVISALVLGQETT